MAIAEMFPYSDQHNLNLDWIIMKIKEFSGNQISGISITQVDTDTIKFVVTYTDGSTTELEEVTLPEGPQGPQGETGETGATPNLTAGTVTTLPAGSDATVSITGTAENPVLNLGIPQGIQGETGAPGGIDDIDGYTGSVTTQGGLKISNTGVLSSQDFDLTTTGSIAYTAYTDANVSIRPWSELFYALNTDKTIGKIYGNIAYIAGTIGSNTWMDLETPITVKAPDTAYDIVPGTYAFGNGGYAGTNRKVKLTIDTAGKVHIKAELQPSDSTNAFDLPLPACLYFFEDFGDDPS